MEQDGTDSTRDDLVISESQNNGEEKPLQVPVIVGNYTYYVPQQSEIEYEDYTTLVAGSDYGITSYSINDAPQTADAVV